MKTKVGAVLLLVAGVLLTVAFTFAQQPDQDPLGRYVFPPELVMQHQQQIELTAEQKNYLRSEVKQVTVRFTELQWQLQDAMEGLVVMMKQSSVNEQEAQTQLDKVLGIEREIKHLHVGLAIRIKNNLTPEQQAKLETIRESRK
jgi:Spy/CpxP family protein refolding chaperone